MNFFRIDKLSIPEKCASSYPPHHWEKWLMWGKMPLLRLKTYPRYDRWDTPQVRKLRLEAQKYDHTADVTSKNG